MGYSPCGYKESDTTDFLSMHTHSRNERTQGERIKERVNTCKPMADSFQCMTKSTTIKKKKSEQEKG